MRQSKDGIKKHIFCQRLGRGKWSHLFPWVSLPLIQICIPHISLHFEYPLHSVFKMKAWIYWWHKSLLRIPDVEVHYTNSVHCTFLFGWGVVVIGHMRSSDFSLLYWTKKKASQVTSDIWKEYYRNYVCEWMEWTIHEHRMYCSLFYSWKLVCCTCKGHW